MPEPQQAADHVADGLAQTSQGPTIDAVISDLRAAVEALNRGDVEPFVALFDENSEWRGIVSGYLWWKQQPS